jgi:hypothetical protein
VYRHILEEGRSNVVIIGPGLQCRRPGQSAIDRRSWSILIEPPVLAGQGDGGGCPRKSQRTWRLRPQVTLVVQDETARVLDTGLGSFYALDPIGTRMLLAAMDLGPEEMVRALAKDFQVSESRVREDWLALVEDLRKSGLTECVRLNAAKEPGCLRIWLRLTLAWISFRLLGWEKTLRFWGRQSHPAVGTRKADSTIAEIDQRVRRLASRHPLNPQCKERAVVSWHLLKRMGLPARLFMGVTLYPFTAHAWAECAGRIVGDDPERCEQFVPVAVYE